MLALAACSRPYAAPQAGQPVETRPPEASGQRPAFAGQTRAPYRPANVAFDVVTAAGGLENPWGLAFLPDGRMLVTERPGRLRIVGKDGTLSAPLAGVPAVVAQGQGGLLDVALDPAFAFNRRVYLSYLEPRTGGAGIAVARAELAGSLANLKVIFRAEPTRGGSTNVGSRLVFAPDGALFVTVGDRFSHAERAQDLDADSGKIVRITTDGAPAPGNPFVGRPGARPEIWSLGHRNPQAAAINPATNQLWIVEHGARGGDEVNVIKPGANYGWPVITYGEDYSGFPVGQGITAKPGMEQPIYYWDPVIAPSGMAFYGADLFPAWKGSLFVGALRGEHLDRLVLDGQRIVGEERLLIDLHERIRDVRVGPDGAVYVLTDNS
ncbi:MAG TPA: PQQ-dependent sugar dehydrogenase, partial [Caulobacteraceae bacterium]|nr:PQQ-dependent sugar dehydrogenase [Caulobacteraceae bacterium]